MTHPILAPLHAVNRTADLGLRFAGSCCAACALGQPCDSAIAPSRSVQDQVGFTTPTGIFDRMRALNAKAIRVDANTRNFVPNTPAGRVFKEAWAGWLAEWTPLYERYAGPHASTASKALIWARSDEFSGQIQDHENQFESLLSSYNSQKSATGTAVPQISFAEAPAAPTTSVPWWFWMGAGFLLVGGGYYAYGRYYGGKKR